MRKRFNNYDKSISPTFIEATNSENRKIKEIERKIGFPAIVKPTGLASSRLVHMCKNKKELKQALEKIFNYIEDVYEKNDGNWNPDVIVEEYMEGEMYSVDGYVDEKGKVVFCPLVENKTGRDVDFDDFFDYLRITPSTLSKEEKTKAKKVVKKGVHALGLKNTTIHGELKLTPEGWKIIEIGPRIGGSRDVMYEKSYGINHTMNDILNKIPQENVRINTSPKGVSAAMTFYAKQEGVFRKIQNLDKIKSIESLEKVIKKKDPGEKCMFAKNGGSGALHLYLFNKNRSQLMQDINKLEETIEIKVK